jgi:hypothetical protein
VLASSLALASIGCQNEEGKNNSQELKMKEKNKKWSI